MNWKQLNLLFILFVLSSHSCKEDGSKEVHFENEKELQEKLIKFNQNKVKAETDIIADFAKDNYPNSTTTNTGVYYEIYSSGDSLRIKNKDVAIVNYSINLLGGEQIYSTQKNGPEKIWIGHDDVPSGLHEGLMLMARGDSAILIMPSYRAYGFTGDQGVIPQNAILIYHIDLIDIE
jgi:FKBP-type peptidyl-prolyl cis-trans isomerase